MTAGRTAGRDSEMAMWYAHPVSPLSDIPAVFCEDPGQNDHSEQFVFLFRAIISTIRATTRSIFMIGLTLGSRSGSSEVSSSRKSPMMSSTSTRLASPATAP